MTQKINMLPYEFDLCFDIKTKAQLVKEVSYLRERLGSLEDLMKKHGIEIKEKKKRGNNG